MWAHTYHIINLFNTCPQAGCSVAKATTVSSTSWGTQFLIPPGISWNAAGLVQFLERVEAVPAILQDLARLRDVAELFDQFLATPPSS